MSTIALLDDLIKPIINKYSKNDIIQIKNSINFICNNNGICVNWYQQSKNDKLRCLFINNESLLHMGKYNYCANSLIVTIPDLEIVCLPGKINIHSAHNLEELESLFDSDIQKIESLNDGTMLSLYYYNNMFNISTNKGICMNSVKPQGIYVSYMQILNEVFDNFDININDFDKTCTYNFGITHPQLHPHSNKYNLWMKSKINTKLGTMVPYEQFLEPFVLPSIAQTLKNLPASVYGYRIETSQSSIIYESDLMYFIRMNYYDDKINKFLGHNKNNKELYVCLKYVVSNFDNDDKLSKFKDVFQKFTTLVDDLTSDINNIIDEIYNKLCDETYFIQNKNFNSIYKNIITSKSKFGENVSKKTIKTLILSDNLFGNLYSVFKAKVIYENEINNQLDNIKSNHHIDLKKIYQLLKDLEEVNTPDVFEYIIDDLNDRFSIFSPDHI